MDTPSPMPALRPETDIHTLVAAGRGLQARAVRGALSWLFRAFRPAEPKGAPVHGIPQAS